MSTQSQADAQLYALSTSTTRARKVRYTLGSLAQRTGEGGRVGIGVDQNGERYLVHTDIPQRATEAVAIGAFATAVVHALPSDTLVKLFKDEGKLKELVAAAVKLDPSLKPAAPAPKAPKADTPSASK